MPLLVKVLLCCYLLPSLKIYWPHIASPGSVAWVLVCFWVRYANQHRHADIAWMALVLPALPVTDLWTHFCVLSVCLWPVFYTQYLVYPVLLFRHPLPNVECRVILHLTGFHMVLGRRIHQFRHRPLLCRGIHLYGRGKFLSLIHIWRCRRRD